MGMRMQLTRELSEGTHLRNNRINSYCDCTLATHTHTMHSVVWVLEGPAPHQFSGTSSIHEGGANQVNRWESNLGLSVGTPQEQTVNCTLRQHVCPHIMHTLIMAY